MRRKKGFAPIGAYAALGDGRTVALVAADGAIDFLSLRDIHAPSTFAALLDPEKGGRFGLAPTASFDANRRYLDRSNVLETTYTTRDGAVRVTEALSLQDGGLLPWTEVVRRVEGLSGEVEMTWRVEPRFDWGRVAPAIEMRRGSVVAHGAGLRVGIHTWDAGDPAIGGDAVQGVFRIREGERALLALCATEDEPIPMPLRADVERRIDRTVEVWRRWLGGWDYEGPWAEHVARSALALKLLVHAPSGAIVAAPTTSLPERIGGDKNYDYRYMWVRDAAFTLDALIGLGLPEQVHESFSCLLRAVRSTAPDVHPFYTVDGEAAQRRDRLPLRGYRDSRPVRYGNAAASQIQLGTWGDLIETTSMYVRHGNALDPDTAKMLAGCIDRVAIAWQDADSGMWELDDRRHYTSSKMGVWMAFDRGLALVEHGELPGDHVAHWRKQRDAVRAFVEARCWSDELGAYVEFAGGDSLDAGVLRGAHMGWQDHSAERFGLTIDAVRAGLDAGGGLLYRTTRECGHEGAFLACSFWLVSALAKMSRIDEAEALFEQLLDYENDVGLLSEEVDPSSGDLLGNFPQGLSHLTLINAAVTIAAARDAGPSAREGAGVG
ncbi:MAG: glycoside hydrolase family 15 protein [Acidobacteriota bacterium]|nr:glycoside hydrolase family 15 protein [Acidobacteriota bacterium]